MPSPCDLAQANIYGFNVKSDRGVLNMARREGVQIECHNVIYDIIDHAQEELDDFGPQARARCRPHPLPAAK